MDRTYKWKYFRGGRYTDNSYESNVYHFLEESLFNPVIPNTYTHFELPEDVENLLKELLKHYNLIEHFSDYTTLGIVLQYNYIHLFEDTKDAVLEDFDNEYKELTKLLALLKDYLFSENFKNLPDISFKPLINNTTHIKNFFVKKDIYKAICAGFGLTKENYEYRSLELIKMTNSVKIDKYTDKLKLDAFYILHKYFSEQGHERVYILKFIGIFFRLFQIPLSSNTLTIELFSSLEDELKEVNIKLLNHYLTRPPKLLHH